MKTRETIKNCITNIAAAKGKIAVVYKSELAWKPDLSKKQKPNSYKKEIESTKVKPYFYRRFTLGLAKDKRQRALSCSLLGSGWAVSTPGR